ncbi:MAG: Multidrug export protein AcrF [Planctomycetota bacterium]
MRIVEGSIRQPVTVLVGVVLVLVGALVAVRQVPVQLTPDVDDTIVSVITVWPGASPEEVEQSIVEKQEEKLQGVAGVRAMTSSASQGSARVRLEFTPGTDKDAAIREVSDRLRQVPDYPFGVDEPVVEASDPENKDYIAWIVLSAGTAKARDGTPFDIRTLQDFAVDRVKPQIERVPGVAEVNVLGGRERVLQVRVDPAALAARGVTISTLAAALRAANQNAPAGSLAESKRDIVLRAVGQFESTADVARVAIAQGASGPILVGDVAEVVETWKEVDNFVRSQGIPVLAINVQKEVGSNVIEVMEGVDAALEGLRVKGGILDAETAELGISEPLTIAKVFDQTVYIDDALDLVLDNIWQGGLLAVLTLVVFLRSWRSIVIVATSVPLAVVATVIVMLGMGRTINVVSLAGLAFAIGTLIDNSIVVLENVVRHMEMGKDARKAALAGTQEVAGAILGSTLATCVVFIPIFLIGDEVGQLFRDISLAILISNMLSMVVSITVTPCACAFLLKAPKAKRPAGEAAPAKKAPLGERFATAIARWVYRMSGRRVASIAFVLLMMGVSVLGSRLLMPPADYLPKGNRNLVFGLILPPPGTSNAMQEEIARRVEKSVEPYWERNLPARGTPEREAAEAALPKVPVTPWMTFKYGQEVQPAPLENYFVVGFSGTMFHGGIAAEASRASYNEHLLGYATRGEVLPGTMAFAFQVPLFRTSGSSGSAVAVDLRGDDLDRVKAAAGAMMGRFIGKFGPMSVQPDPANFATPGSEVRVRPDLRRLSDAGITPQDLTLSVAAAGDGALIDEYKAGGDSIDLVIIDRRSAESAAAQRSMDADEVSDVPVALPGGRLATVGQLAQIERGAAPTQINHVDRQRSVRLQVTPPPTMALEEAVTTIRAELDAARAEGVVPAGVVADVAGTASALAEVRQELVGGGSWLAFLTSTVFLALLVCYLVMAVLFQSFRLPFVIMFSVPLAAVGGFAALFAVFLVSLTSPTLPMQSLDTLTMLGFVILIGVVVNNAILLVHQTLNFQRGTADETPSDAAFRGLPDAPAVEAGGKLPLRAAIAESVRTRVRPILMSAFTSVAGLLPLIFAPGAGSELYRGLGAVMGGGLLVSTVFTIVVVPVVMALVVRERPAA